MFRVKICGITNVADALHCAEAGADAIGLNFFGRSPRYVEPPRAAEISNTVAGRLLRVGLFVNADEAEIRRVATTVPLDAIQLHGDEPPQLVAALRPWPVIRVFRLAAGGLGTALEHLARCAAAGVLPRYVLLDACVSGAFGGTGQRADWSAAAEYAAHATQTGQPPLVLAGGLTPANVGAAIRAVRPAAVDTASGVEISPGHKDPVAVAAFVQAAKAAFLNSAAE